MHKLTKIAAILGLVTTLGTATSQAAFFTANQRSPTPEASVSRDPDCTALLGHMRTPKSAEILALSGVRVDVIAICEDLTVPRRNDYGSLFNDGNAGLLRLPIARTPVLINALKARDYDEQDVVSVRFGGNDSVILYVHQRDMR